MIAFELYGAPPLKPATPPYLSDAMAIPRHPLCVSPDAQREHLTIALSNAPSAGHIVECGVFQGWTLNHLASLQPHRTVWGFDSFYGLPVFWDDNHPKGVFSCDGKPPEVLPNVRLEIGLFADTIPVWLAANPGNIAFLHVDCDIYSSTIDILFGLNDRLIPGSIVSFDDMHEFENVGPNPPGKWRSEEWIGMEEWAQRFNRQFSVVSRIYQCCMSIRILT